MSKSFLEHVAKIDNRYFLYFSTNFGSGAELSRDCRLLYVGLRSFSNAWLDGCRGRGSYWVYSTANEEAVVEYTLRYA